jgi:glycerol-3-phosphate acyltransferase PlsY
MNTIKEAGRLAGVAVILLDIAKGAVAILIARFALNLEQPFVLTSGIAAVVGHDWMVWLGFRGGRGMGATVGVLCSALPLYGYATQLGIFFAFVLVPFAFTRIVPLAMAIALAALPFIMWLGTHSGALVVWTLVIGVIAAIRFAQPIIETLTHLSNWRDILNRR